MDNKMDIDVEIQPPSNFNSGFQPNQFNYQQQQPNQFNYQQQQPNQSNQQQPNQFNQQQPNQFNQQFNQQQPNQFNQQQQPNLGEFIIGKPGKVDYDDDRKDLKEESKIKIRGIRKKKYFKKLTKIKNLRKNKKDINRNYEDGNDKIILKSEVILNFFSNRNSNMNPKTLWDMALKIDSIKNDLAVNEVVSRISIDNMFNIFKMISKDNFKRGALMTLKNFSGHESSNTISTILSTDIMNSNQTNISLFLKFMYCHKNNHELIFNCLMTLYNAQCDEQCIIKYLVNNKQFFFFIYKAYGYYSEPKNEVKQSEYNSNVYCNYGVRKGILANCAMLIPEMNHDTWKFVFLNNNFLSMILKSNMSGPYLYRIIDCQIVKFGFYQTDGLVKCLLSGLSYEKNPNDTNVNILLNLSKFIYDKKHQQFLRVMIQNDDIYLKFQKLLSTSIFIRTEKCLSLLKALCNLTLNREISMYLYQKSFNGGREFKPILKILFDAFKHSADIFIKREISLIIANILNNINNKQLFIEILGNEIKSMFIYILKNDTDPHLNRVIINFFSCLLTVFFDEKLIKLFFVDNSLENVINLRKNSTNPQVRSWVNECSNKIEEFKRKISIWNCNNNNNNNSNSNNMMMF